MSKRKRKAQFHPASLSPALNNGLWVGKRWQIPHSSRTQTKRSLHMPLGV